MTERGMSRIGGNNAVRAGRVIGVGEKEGRNGRPTDRIQRSHKTLGPDELESLVSRVSVHLREGNFDAAVAVIQHAANQEETAILRPHDTPLCDILSVRIVNALEENFNAMFVKDVLKLPNASLMGVPGINLGTIRDIDIALERLRLRRVG